MRKAFFSTVRIQILFVLIFSSCKGDEQPADNIRVQSVVRIDCQSVVPQCNNKPGLKFSAFTFGRFIPAPGGGDFELTPYDYTVCCEYIPNLIDSLKMLVDTLDGWLEEKPEEAERSATLPDGTMTTVKYIKKFLDQNDYYYIWFGNPSKEPVFYLLTKEEYEKFIKDVNDRFRTCCLK